MKKNIISNKQSICLLNPYFGKWPVYFDLYLYTVVKQENLQVILFTDIEYQGQLPDNVKIVPMTLDEFNQLASDKLDLDINVVNPYKLCDLRPAYGLIFEDYIYDYTHWAWGDLDLIYGRMFDLLPRDWRDYDVLSLREDWVTGSFAVFKNSKYVNNLFRKSKSYIEFFTSPDHKGFDECLNLYHVLRGEDPNYILTCDSRESFTWVVRKEEDEHNIKVYSKKMIKEYIGIDDFVEYKDGRIRQKDGQEFLYYHYISEKQTFMFDFPKWSTIPEHFYINRYGFFTVNEFLTWRRTPLLFWRKFQGLLRIIRSLPKRVYAKILRILKKA
jgi:hypothetical protein